MPNNEQLDPQAIAMSKAIRSTETQGVRDPWNAKGKSGEWGAYQFTEPTWKKLKQKYNLTGEYGSATQEEQNQAAYHQIKEWKDAGYNIGQVASMWNAGEGEPNAYTGTFSNGKPSRGKNKYGVDYDVPAYAEGVAKQYQYLKTGQVPSTQVKTPSTVEPEKNLGDKLAGRLTDAGNAIGDAFSGKMKAPIISAPLQIAGAAAGAVGDVLGAGLELIPGVKQAEQGAGNVMSKIPGVEQIARGAQRVSEENPELYKDIASGFNIGGLAAGGVGGKVGTTIAKEGLVSAAEKGLAGKAIQGAMDRSYLKAAEGALESGPKLADVKAGIKKGNLTMEGLAPDAQKTLSIRHLADAMKEGIVPKKGTKAQIAISAEKAAVQESKNLEKLLSQQDVVPTVQPEQIDEMMKKVLARSQDSLSNGENPAHTLLQVFAKALPNKTDITPLDILKARRAVGEYVRANRGDWNMRGVLTGFKSARNAFWDESRDLLAAIAPEGVDVLKSLEKQAALYRISDYIAPLVKSELIAGPKEGIVKRGLKAGAREIGKGILIGTGLAPAARFIEGL